MPYRESRGKLHFNSRYIYRKLLQVYSAESSDIIFITRLSLLLTNIALWDRDKGCFRIARRSFGKTKPPVRGLSVFTHRIPSSGTLSSPPSPTPQLHTRWIIAYDDSRKKMPVTCAAITRIPPFSGGFEQIYGLLTCKFNRKIGCNGGPGSTVTITS